MALQTLVTRRWRVLAISLIRRKRIGRLYGRLSRSHRAYFVKYRTDHTDIAGIASQADRGIRSVLASETEGGHFIRALAKAFDTQDSASLQEIAVMATTTCFARQDIQTIYRGDDLIRRGTAIGVDQHVTFT